MEGWIAAGLVAGFVVVILLLNTIEFGRPD